MQIISTIIGGLLLIVGLMIVAYIGYWILGILIWAFPFLLAIALVGFVIYAIFYAIFDKK